MRTSAVVLMILVCGAACDPSKAGDEPPRQDPLPEAPQILPNPDRAFIVFTLTDAGSSDSSEFVLTLANGGQDDLVISDIRVEDDTASVFTLDADPGTIESREADTVRLTFTPPARGVYQGRLVIESNAENAPTLAYEIVAPAAANLLADAPDIEVFEDTATAVDVGAGQLAFVRYINLGAGLLSATSYSIIDDTDDAFAMPIACDEGVTTGCQVVPLDCSETCPVESPAATCEPVLLGAGDFAVLTIEYNPPAAGSHEATFRIQSNDPDTCEKDVTLTGTNG